MIPLQLGVFQRFGRRIAVLFHDRGTRRCEWSTTRPGRTLALERHRILCTGGWVSRKAHLDVWKILSPQKFDSRPSSS